MNYLQDHGVIENQPEAKLETELEKGKASDKIVEILADLEAIEVLEEPEEGVETSKDEIAEFLPEIDTKNTVVEIPDEILTHNSVSKAKSVALKNLKRR